MAAIVGTKQADEISICRRGANQHSHALITKALKPAPASKGPEPAPETDVMDFALLKAVAGLNDITKAYFLTLDDAAGEAFMKKSAEDRDAEAKKAHDEAEAKKTAAEKAEKDRAEAETDTSKKLDLALSENATLKARLDDKDADEVIRKTAAGADFKGYPGGEETVFSMLKGMSKLDAPVRDGLIAGMKATAKAALVTSTELGGRDDTELAKSAPATVEFNQKVKAYAAEKSVNETVATTKVMELEKALYSRVLAEQGAV